MKEDSSLYKEFHWQQISIAWSGGFDSTAYLLYCLSHPEVHDIDLVCFDVNPYQSQSEFVSRINILNLIKNNHPEQYKKIKFENVNRTHELDIGKSGDTSNEQSLIWASLLPMVSYYKDIAIVNVFDDHVYWHFKHEIETIFNCALKIINQRRDYKLHFPFEWVKKENMVDYFLPYPNVFEQLSVNTNGIHWLLDVDNKEDKSLKTRDLYNLYKKKIKDTQERINLLDYQI